MNPEKAGTAEKRKKIGAGFPAPMSFILVTRKEGACVKNMGKHFRDVALFGKVLSVGLLIGGYAFAGVFIARWMEGKGYPPLLVAAAPVAVTLFGLWQGWLFLTQFGKKKK